MLSGLHKWLDAKGFGSLENVRGIMSQRNMRDPQAFERANYIKILQGYRPPGQSIGAPQPVLVPSPGNGTASTGLRG